MIAHVYSKRMFHRHYAHTRKFRLGAKAERFEISESVFALSVLFVVHSTLFAAE
jgi:hypothetical protein